MYDELIKRLRNRRICFQQSGGIDDFPLLKEAADAIEELKKQLDNAEIENIKLKEEFAKYRGKNRWIPVTERLPKEEQEIYWCYTNMGIMCECRWTNNRWGLGESDRWGWNIMDVPQYHKITHWMPLPAPPKEET